MALIEALQQLVTQGGPEPGDYALLGHIFSWAADSAPAATQVRDSLMPTMNAQCIHGYGFLKPRGYAGDFEMIDKIYTRWVSPEQGLKKWDAFFHAQPAPCAVRNRKTFFKALLRRLNAHNPGAAVLNIGSGSGRDVYEFYQENPDSTLTIHCIDLDQSALDFASALCRPYSGRVTFEHANALRYKPKRSYHLMWSAGLFDYLSDRTVTTLMRRLRTHLTPNGELVVGNFSPANASRQYMEVVAQWHLIHRSKDELLELAAGAGFSKNQLTVEEESLGINLFLRAKG